MWLEGVGTIPEYTAVNEMNEGGGGAALRMRSVAGFEKVAYAFDVRKKRDNLY